MTFKHIITRHNYFSGINMKICHDNWDNGGVSLYLMFIKVTTKFVQDVSYLIPPISS